ncbi:hypothetical protein PO909_024065 [Leuciscus waleckii]
MTSSKVELPGEVKNDPAALMASLHLVPSPIPNPEIKYTKLCEASRELAWADEKRISVLQLLESFESPPPPQKGSSLAVALPEEQSRPPAFVDDNPLSCVNIAGDKNLSNEEHKPSDAVIVRCGSFFHNLFMIGTAYLAI